MEKQEFKKELLQKRMEYKSKIEMLKYLPNYEKEIDRLLDLINTIDKILKELEK
ncbi:hypothetical protein [Dysgonomonas sp. 520]|uniref:hypothetical protein n=1 Tax=Dysgonomonas sp. 520 TaxID=2302931 RepID=UPI0013D1A1C8|nr:hypothetical protein [Dysgonomonas sp. 520]